MNTAPATGAEGSASPVASASPEHAPRPNLETRDRMLMRAALFQARRGLGRTWPNPSVGAVIAHPGTGEIFGSAVTAAGGRPHAEVLALAEAGARARGAVMVTTLEPCAHFGVTPPCADAIADAGLAEVLYGTLDPDPRVSGAGIARMASQGIRVRLAPYSEEARWLNLGHALRVGSARPFVQLKLAVDADGFVAAGEGRPVWVTSEEARARAHLLRAEADAILVGRTTVSDDNPLLTCRLPGLSHRSPVRVILTSEGQIPTDIDLFTVPGPPVWILLGERTPPHVVARLEAAGAAVVKVAAPPGQRLAIADALRALAERGITRLLVEGGPSVARAFFESGLADEILLFQGRARMPASAHKLKPFATDDIGLIAKSARYRLVSSAQAGSSSVSTYRLRDHLEG